MWNVEQTTMIPKKKVLESSKDLRPIAITLIFSKIFEGIVRKPSLKDISSQMHHEQYGGVSGVSPNHYLSGLLHDVVTASEDGCSSILLTFDFSSAFDSLNHDKVIGASSRLGVRRCLLRLMSSYLSSKRYTVVRWGDSKSSPRLSRGGSGQGTLLRVSLFLIAVNGLLEELEEKIIQFKGLSRTRSRPRLYVDDLAILVPFKLSNFPVNSDGVRLFKDDGRIKAYLNEGSWRILPYYWNETQQIQDSWCCL